MCGCGCGYGRVCMCLCVLQVQVLQVICLSNIFPYKSCERESTKLTTIFKDFKKKLVCVRNFLVYVYAYCFSLLFIVYKLFIFMTYRVISNEISFIRLIWKNMWQTNNLCTILKSYFVNRVHHT